MQGVPLRDYYRKEFKCVPVEWVYKHSINTALYKILIRTIERLGVDVGSLLLKKLPFLIGVKYEK